MGKPMNLRVAAGLAILLLAGCLTIGGPVRDANAQTTPLHEAAASGHSFTIQALLKGGADVNTRADDGSTPLHAAAAVGQMASIQVLLAGGAAVNAKADDGSTPLHQAAMAIWNRAEIIPTLLAGGANVDARDEAGGTPLHYAATGKTIIDALEAAAKGDRDEGSRAVARAAGLDTLGEADRNAFLANLKGAAADQTSVIQALLASGADVNARNDEEGSTPLHVAASSGDVTAIRALLAGGADVNANAHKKGGATPLHVAAASGKAAVIPALLSGGADVNARAEGGDTPLHAAAMRKLILAALEADAKGGRDKLLKAYSEMVSEIIESFDTLDEADWEINVAILKSGDDDRADTVRALLAGGANVNARNDGRGTPLHNAALSGDAAAVEALLDAGGDPNAVAFGCGPMDMARRRMENTETSIAPFRDSIEALRAAGGRPQKGCRF